ncbi:hypothetical protein WNB94_17175 [Aquabacterium sp. A3]|uniref:hypothetical protein n=1 Tax=Aquabacterium sp. A3 TaxID=3132829 RepID=UPI0031196B21
MNARPATALFQATITLMGLFLLGSLRLCQPTAKTAGIASPGQNSTHPISIKYKFISPNHLFGIKVYLPWKKIGLWGSIASIVGLALVFFPPSASSQGEQKSQATTSGAKSPAIGTNQGNITINYGGDSTTPEKRYVLRNPRTGATLVVDKPSLDAAQDPKHHVCTALAGTAVIPTGESEKMAGIDMWRKIRITSGECTNKSGWVAIENLSVE